MSNFLFFKKNQSVLLSLRSSLEEPFADIYLNELIKYHQNPKICLARSANLSQYDFVKNELENKQ